MNENKIREIVAELQSLKKENTEIKNRLRKVETELSRRHILGINNIMSSSNVVDDIWSEEDDTI
jgi:hypothetical protein